MNWLIVDDLIRSALKEDISIEDITTDSTIDEESNSMVDLIAKEEGILAGIEVFARVFTILGKIEVELFKKDGDILEKGNLIGIIKGNTREILHGERVALNYLQRMCGIATLTNNYITELKGTNTKLLDTRKTTPNMRILEKYAVRIGGGENHRFSLSDGILLKDNHIAAAGGVKNAIDMVRRSASFVRKIEVEVETIEMVIEALEGKADIIMLDNMNLDDMKRAVEIINRQALIEASGNVTLKTIRHLAETGVDYISVGALTHSYKALDLSMKNLRNI